MSKRSFTVEASSAGEVGGRYTTRTGGPRDAAAKAARMMFSSSSKNKNDKISLQLRETTRGRNARRFAYEASKRKVPVRTVDIAGRKVRFTQDIRLRKIPPFFGEDEKKPRQQRRNKQKNRKSTTRGGASGVDDVVHDAFVVMKTRKDHAQVSFTDVVPVKMTADDSGDNSEWEVMQLVDVVSQVQISGNNTVTFRGRRVYTSNGISPLPEKEDDKAEFLRETFRDAALVPDATIRGRYAEEEEGGNLNVDYQQFRSNAHLVVAFDYDDDETGGVLDWHIDAETMSDLKEQMQNGHLQLPKAPKNSGDDGVIKSTTARKAFASHLAERLQINLNALLIDEFMEKEYTDADDDEEEEYRDDEKDEDVEEEKNAASFVLVECLMYSPYMNARYPNYSDDVMRLIEFSDDSSFLMDSYIASVFSKPLHLDALLRQTAANDDDANNIHALQSRIERVMARLDSASASGDENDPRYLMLSLEVIRLHAAKDVLSQIVTEGYRPDDTDYGVSVLRQMHKLGKVMKLQRHLTTDPRYSYAIQGAIEDTQEFLQKESRTARR